MNKQKKYSILIVDDEKSNIIVLANILESEYKIYAVKDGREAVETAEEDLPDVILLDILMPEMDGYAVIAELKKSEKTRDIPVIFITGLNNDEAEEKGFALGAADYIPKPFNSAIVKLRIQNQIKLIERLRQQALMTRISYSFLSDVHIDVLFSDTLRMVGEFMDVAQILLYKNEDDNTTIICRNEWINPKLNLETRLGSKFEIKEPLLSLLSGFMKRGNLCIHSNDPSIKNLMKSYRKNFHNYIVAPIYIKGKLHTLLDFSRDGEYEWTDSEIDLAVLVSSIFSGIFERGAIEHDLNVVLKLKAELIAAKEQAEHLSCVKSEFLSRMSHEMRTPMNAITGILQIIKMQNIPENIKNYLNEIINASNDLQRLIDDVLDMSNIENGMLKLSESVFNVNVMFKEVLQSASYKSSTKQQVVKSNIDPAMPGSLAGDEKRLKQVIANLLDNAIKFTPEQGEIRLEAGVNNINGGIITLKIKVSDNGIGIAKEQQDKLFTIFEQVDGSDTREYGGTGLGLALSKRIVGIMGGKIWVESELNKGACFYFTCKLKTV